MRGFYTDTKVYGGVDGTVYDCGNSLERTCMATMQNGRFRAPLKIFYTDYENIEIGYGCQNTFTGKVE